MTLTRQRIPNRTVNPLLTSLPDFVKSLSPLQVKAVDEILRAFNDVDVVVLDAPTGTGKTLIGEVVRRMMQQKALYVCHSLSLQDQFVKDFPYARVVKGRANYETEEYPQSYPDVSCDDCTWTPENVSCKWCSRKSRCPYEVAKLRGIGADLAVLNSSYALTEWNGPGRFSGRGLVIVDEADTLEDAVMEHVSVEVSERRMRQFGWGTPKVTVRDSWVEWLEGRIPELKRRVEACGDDKEKKRLTRLLERMRVVQNQLSCGLPYAFTGKGEEAGFKPVFVGDYCPESLWRHGKKWLLMSASVISAGGLLRGLGYKKDSATVCLPSTFPIGNRPVLIRPVANMSKATWESEYGKLEAEIRRLVDNEPGRVVIHTVSYQLAGHIQRSLGVCGRTVVSYRMAGDRARALSEYIRTPGSILVAPSADRGIDLPDDLCRLTIIAKVPYPNLGDRQVSLRLWSGAEGRTWYTAETVRSIVQMAGRGVRHKDDWCTTVVLDSQFEGGVWSRGRWLFPPWFREAIVWQKR